MKPAECRLCGRDFRSEWFHTQAGGELVAFGDYTPLPEGYVGFPHGMGWFCREHAPAARELIHLDFAAALADLQRKFGTFPAPEPTLMRNPRLWVVEVGPNPARVFALFRRATGLPATEALALFRSGEFEVARGWPAQFEQWRSELVAAGARVEIRYD